MNEDKIAITLLEHTKVITALQESAKTAHKRIDKMDKLTEAVHELARSNTVIATEVKALATKFDKTTERIERGQKSQGERLGIIERNIARVRKNEKEIAEIYDKLDVLRMEPGERWKYLVFALIGGVVAAGLGVIGGNFLM